MGELRGVATYPGITGFESFRWTDISGISPSIITLTYFPLTGRPDLIGDFRLTYENTVIYIRDCIFDADSVQSGSAGQSVTARFFDSRWRWQFRSVTGRYNIRLPNNFVDPAHEATPEQLAQLCLNQLVGAASYDASILGTLVPDARPEVNWDFTNAAEALASLLDQFECRIICQRSSGKWIVVQQGEGNVLPNSPPYTDDFPSIDPKEMPDFIRIVTAPSLYQWAQHLEPIGRDVDMSWQSLILLSYADTTMSVLTSFGLGIDPISQAGISNIRVEQEDGTRISPQELALQTVFRCWRIDDGLTLVENPYYGQSSVPCPWNVNGDHTYPSRKQIILSDQLAQVYMDSYGQQHARPAFAFAQYQDSLGTKYPLFSIPYRRTDWQGAAFITNPDAPITFAMSLNPIDTDRTIITFSDQMLFPLLPGQTSYTFANVYLMCAAQIRDPNTFQPIRYEYYMPTFDSSGLTPTQIAQLPILDHTLCYTVIKDDIQPWYVATYPNGDPTQTPTLDNNLKEVETQCEYYATQLLRRFEAIQARTRKYLGWFFIDLDGAITQITYTSNSGGTTMECSRGTEHSFDTPTYQERRQRDGRQNIEEKLRLIQEISDRFAKSRGTFNT